MSLMDLLDDYFFGPFNVISRFEGTLKLLLFQDRGIRFAILRLDKGGEHSLAEVQELLQRYHIDTFGCTHDAQHLYFLTKARQAAWAEYILLRAGVKTFNAVINPRNSHYAAKYAPGSLPIPWDEKSRAEETTLVSSSHQDNRAEDHERKPVNSLSSQFTQMLDSLFD